MRRVLVISDNEKLLKFFIELVDNQQLYKMAKFEYRYSIINKEPALMAALRCTPIDVKDPRTVDFIVKNFDLVISIHSKQIFPEDLVLGVQCINVHPGLNPYNRGWYPQVFSIINKKPLGATIHIMNQDVDAGPILFQKTVKIDSFDTSLSAYKKVQQAEIELLKENIKSIIAGDSYDFLYPSAGNYNSISDFRDICVLDLTDVGTLANHLDRLRALSHGEFNNAYFVDDDGKKVFVKITLVPELQLNK